MNAERNAPLRCEHVVAREDLLLVQPDRRKGVESLEDEIGRVPSDLGRLEAAAIEPIGLADPLNLLYSGIQ